MECSTKHSHVNVLKFPSEIKFCNAKLEFNYLLGSKKSKSGKMGNVALTVTWGLQEIGKLNIFEKSKIIAFWVLLEICSEKSIGP